MNVEIEQLIYYVKELYNTDIIEITEKGFRYVFEVNGVPMNCYIDIEQDSFTVIAEDKTLKVLFTEKDLKNRFRQLTEYIEVLKRFITSTTVYSNKKLRE